MRGAGWIEHVQGGRVSEQPCDQRPGQTNPEDKMGRHVELTVQRSRNLV